MKTTGTNDNLVKAQRLLELRNTLKVLKKEETLLKEYFADLIEDDTNLIVKSAIVISKTQAQRTTYTKSKLDNYFDTNSIDADQFKTTTTFFKLAVGEY